MKTEPIYINKYRQQKEMSTESPFGYDPLTIDQIKALYHYQLLTNFDMSDRIRYTELDKGFLEQGATKEEPKVDWQERYIDKLDRDVTDMKSSLRATEERIAGMINQTLGEMRDRDNQRHTEFLALRSDNAETRRWIIGMVIAATGVALAAIFGIVSIVIGN